MSIRVMTLCFDAHFGSSARKFVAIALADHADDDGERVYPSIARIAAKTELSERTVQYCLRDFEQIGLLSVISEGGCGPRCTREWKFDLMLLRNIAERNCEIVEADKGADGAPLRVQPVQGRVQLTADKGAPVAPEPSKNRQEPYAQARAHEGAPAFASQQKTKKGLGREVHPPATITPSTWIKPGTPQWQAWLAHEQARTKSEWPAMRGKDQWLVPSAFPPVEKVRT